MSSLIKLSEVTKNSRTDFWLNVKSCLKIHLCIISCVFLLSAPLAGVAVPEIVARSRRANCVSHRQLLFHFLGPTLALPHVTQLT